MRKKEFLEELKKRLVGLPKEDVKEIIEDYEEHFRVGKKKKRKESEIAKSLGNPKNIARDARQELKSNRSFNLENWFVEFWVGLKDVCIHVYYAILGFFKSLLKSLAGKSGKKSSKKSKKKRSFWKMFFLVVLDIFLAIWLFIAFFVIIYSLFLSGMIISLSGIVVIVFSIMGLIYPSSFELNNLFLSSLFSGIGIVVVGILLSICFWQGGRGLVWIVRKYGKLHRNVFGGKNE
jgi:uncharacterized membrane protein